MTQPTYTFPEMASHIVTADCDTLPIAHELVEEEADGYTPDELQCLFELLQFQYSITTGSLLRALINSILK